MKLVVAVLLAATLLGCTSDGGDSTADVVAAIATSTTVAAAPARIPEIACGATRDAVDAAAIAFLADHGSYPSTFAELVEGGYVEVPAGVEVVAEPPGDRLSGPGWTLRISGDGSAPPELVCTDAVPQ